MVLHGGIAAETTSVLLTKHLRTVPCLRHQTPHHCGDLDPFRTIGQTSVDFSNSVIWSQQIFPYQSPKQKRLSIYNWNPGPRRGKEDAFEKQIAGRWHIITLQEASEYVEHKFLRERFHVTHFAGCARRTRKREDFHPKGSKLEKKFFSEESSDSASTWSHNWWNSDEWQESRTQKHQCW